MIVRVRGFEVHDAQDGLAAGELARSLRPALILMDMTMPGKDGYAATRELEQEPHELLVRELAALPRRSVDCTTSEPSPKARTT